MDFDGLMPHVPLWEVVARILLALALGGLIGWERERQHKPAGLRTHMMVTLGAATFVILGLEVVEELSPRFEHARIDPTRIIEGVVGGIGFLGAGSIIQSRGNVRGITTAASVWVSGALGAACGVGAYVVAAISAFLAIITLAVLGRFENKLDES